MKNQNEKEVYFKKNENTEGVRNDEKSDVMSTEQKTVISTENDRNMP